MAVSLPNPITMVQVPTKPLEVVYRDKNGKEFKPSEMSTHELDIALYDMLQRKAKHNHKMNKMFAVGETLSRVVKTLHAEKAQRTEPNTIAPYYEMQILADQGRLRFTQQETDLTIDDDE